ncbi:tumor susceptibility gene 101 protein [Plakobranchus ocellatus]|uniref:Tumor susceptibility gene 101 protein n=1 Tax=Plakobranchus ocellatus TaxID=259542 RepID=A0AAV4B643_9GAST|nr:tumor susceptibility gene 101 protein [Plakobranchus ocellatus]
MHKQCSKVGLRKRFQIRTWLTQSYLLKNEEEPFCYACDSLDTVRHILIECPDFQDTKRKYFSVTDLYRLFQEINPSRIVGNLYNIPVSLWILDTHPYDPPMVYVKPTSTMQIKPSQHVDANGKVDIPYLREWRHPKSDLLLLVQVLILMFGEECPVFSRASNTRLPLHQPLTYPSSTPYPTNPGGMPMPGMPYPSVSSSAGPPGYPPAGSLNYPPYPPAGGPGYPSQGVTPPYPSYPPSSQGGGGYPYPGSSGNLSYPSAHPPGPPGYGGPGGYPPSSQFNNHQPPFSTASNGGSAAQSPAFNLGGTVTEADLKASLLSAVEDKMKRRLKETFAQAQV